MDDPGPAEEGERRPRHWAWRLLRGVLGGIFWFFAFLGTFVASTLLHLDSKAARDEIATQVEPILDEMLVGEFSMDVEHVSLDHIEVDDFEVRDADGVLVLSVAEAVVDVSRMDLFLGQLVVERVRVRDPFVDLAADESGELRIANAFTPVDPKPEDPNAKTNIPHILVNDVLLEGGRVANLSPELELRAIRLQAEGTIDDRIDLQVHALEAELVRRDDGAVVASLERFEGEVGLLETGAESTVELRVSGMDGDHVEGQLSATWGEDYPDQYEGELSFRASPQTLRAAGLPEVADLLAAPVEGRVTADGGLAGSFDARVELDTAGGPLVADATFSEEFERIEARVRSEGIALGEVLTPLEDSRFEGTLEAALHPPGDDGRRRVEVDGESVAFTAPDGNTYQAPALHAAAYLGEDHVEILELDLPHLEGERGHLDVTGRVGFDGAMNLVVDAELPDLGADPNLPQVMDGPVDGGLSVDAEVRIEPGAGPNDPMYVDARGEVSGRRLRLPWLTARELDVRGTVRGNLPSPRADLRVQVADLDADGTRIDRADLSVNGGGAGGRYDVDGSVQGTVPDMELDADLDLVATVHDDGGVTVDGSTRVRGPMPQPITVAIDSARFHPDRGVRLGGLRVRTGNMGIAAEGFLDLNGRGSDATVTLERVDLETIAKRFGFEQIGLSGVASAEIAFSGSIDRPVLDTAGRVEDLEIDGVQFQRATWDIDLQPEGAGSQLVLALSIDSEGNGQAQVDARAQLPSRQPLRALPEATWDATVTTANLRLGLVPELVEGVPALQGRVDTQLTFRGTLADPDLVAQISARDFSVPEVDPVNVKVDARVVASDLRLEVDLRQTSNELIASVVANVSDLSLESLTGPQPLGFLASPWSVDIAAPEQSLDSLPRPAHVDLPIVVSAQGRIEGGQEPSRGGDPLQAALRAMTGQLRVLARYTDEPAPGCGSERPRLQTDVLFENGETEVRVVGETGGVENLVVEAFVETPVHEWVETGPSRIPEVELALEARGLELGDVPIVCETASGTADVRVDGVDLFDEEPRVELQATVDSLSVSGSEPLDLGIRGELDATHAEASGELRAEQRVAMRFDGRAPMRWGGEVLVPELPEDGRWQGHVAFDEAPVQPLLAAVPMLAEPIGTIDGDVRASGVGGEVDVEGQLRMDQVGFVLRQPYMRIEDLNGTVALHDQTARIEGLRFSDRDGDVRVDGDIELEGWMPGAARLDIRSDDFPLRVEGVIYAYLDTRTEIEADFGPEVNEIVIRMRQTSVRLPMDIGRSLQPLTQHEDVIYEDQPGFDPNDPIEFPDEEADAASDENAIADRTEIRVRSTPFWVRRDDFSVQVDPRLTIIIDQDGARMVGPVEIRRGFIAFMGKEFEFKQGEVRFTGGNSIDPTVDIEATHDLRAGGEIITAKITGRLLNPELDFSSSRDANISDSEAIQLLVRGRPGASSETATQQAASFLTGLFAGVLSSVTRQELGEYIPVFGIESEGGQATLRVGFQADQLIPDALDDVILGAYVEGYVGGGTSSDGSGGAVVGGATVEFVLPRSLVWSGTYDVPTNWSVDLMWEP